TSRATANTATATTGTSLPTVPAPNTCARTAAPSSRAIETATTSTTRAGAIATAARTAPTAGMATIAAIPATTRRAASTRSRGADAVVHRDVKMGRGFPPHRSLGHDGPACYNRRSGLESRGAHDQVTPLLERDRCLQAAALRRHPAGGATDAPRARSAAASPLRGAAVRDRGPLQLGPLEPDESPPLDPPGHPAGLHVLQHDDVAPRGRPQLRVPVHAARLGTGAGPGLREHERHLGQPVHALAPRPSRQPRGRPRRSQAPLALPQAQRALVQAALLHARPHAAVLPGRGLRGAHLRAGAAPPHPERAPGHDGAAVLDHGRALLLRRLGPDAAHPDRALLPGLPRGLHAQPPGPALQHRPHASAEVGHAHEAEPLLGLPVRLLELPPRAPLLPARALLQPAQGPHAAAAAVRPPRPEAAHVSRDRLAVVRAEPGAAHGLGEGRPPSAGSLVSGEPRRTRPREFPAYDRPGRRSRRHPVSNGNSIDTISRQGLWSGRSVSYRPIIRVRSASCAMPIRPRRPERDPQGRQHAHRHGVDAGRGRPERRSQVEDD